ncbi:MAG TPA: phosphotransferase [Chloroflexota bacterium]|nr:phosphotransferase [Chloroflexota bacterium]
MIVTDNLTTDWLTGILRREGVLGQGHVTAIATEGNPAFNSAISHLHVTYAPGSSSGAPTRLLLKRNVDSEWGYASGKSEVDFYQVARARRDDLPMIVRCYDAAYDPATGDSHLLLLDISASHRPPVTRDDIISLHGVPTQDLLVACVEAIARFHAYWFEHPSPPPAVWEVSRWYGTRQWFDAGVESRRQDWDAFQAGPGADLPAEIRSLYQQAIDGMPALWERCFQGRMGSGRALTIVHGDCYFSQFLCPRDPGGATYVVDWQGARADLPTIDLTHLFATFWTPEQRHEDHRERRMLERYLAELRSAGVTDYDWDMLQYDYRLALIYMIFYPVWDALDGSGRDYWWPKMQCLTSAYRDWDCQELIAPA